MVSVIFSHFLTIQIPNKFLDHLIRTIAKQLSFRINFRNSSGIAKTKRATVLCLTGFRVANRAKPSMTRKPCHAELPSNAGKWNDQILRRALRGDRKRGAASILSSYRGVGKPPKLGAVWGRFSGFCSPIQAFPRCRP